MAEQAIVIDNGSGYVKAGLSGEDLPQYVFRNVVSNQKVENLESKSREAKHTVVVGHDVGKNSSPIERGQIVNWDQMEIVWNHVFEELDINPEAANVPVLLTDSPLPSAKSRMKMAQIMFEVFKVPSLYIVQQSVLSLFASGRTNGIVLDIGYGVTHAVPIFQGYALPHAIRRMGVAGKDVTEKFQRRLANMKMKVNDYHTMNKMKEETCFVKSICNEGNDPSEVAHFELPDETIVDIAPQPRAMAPEVLFRPSLLPDTHPEHESSGIHEMVHKSISMCDKDLASELYGNVVLAGGTSMIPGLSFRMHQELSALNPNANLRMVPSFTTRERGYNTQRKLAAWIGGSMFASLPTFDNLVVTKQDWEESHETIVHRKCF